MQASEQVIEVLNYLCEKIGITIDWTSANIIPYLNELCERYIRYEIATSVVWIVISAVFIIALSIIGKRGFDKYIIRKKNRIPYSVEEDMYLIIAILCFIGAASFLPVLIIQIFDIVECCTFPEKAIFEYIQYQLHQN